MGHPIAHFNCANSPISYTGDANTVKSWWIAGPPWYAANYPKQSSAEPATTPAPVTLASSTPAPSTTPALVDATASGKPKRKETESIRELAGLLSPTIHAEANIDLKRGNRARRAPMTSSLVKQATDRQADLRDRKPAAAKKRYKDQSESSSDEEDEIVRTPSPKLRPQDYSCSPAATRDEPSADKTQTKKRKTGRHEAKTVHRKQETKQEPIPHEAKTSHQEPPKPSMKFRQRQPTSLRHYGDMEDPETSKLPPNPNKPTLPVNAPGRGPHQPLPTNLTVPKFGHPSGISVNLQPDFLRVAENDSDATDTDIPFFKPPTSQRGEGNVGGTFGTSPGAGIRHFKRPFSRNYAETSTTFGLPQSSSNPLNPSISLRSPGTPVAVGATTTASYPPISGGADKQTSKENSTSVNTSIPAFSPPTNQTSKATSGAQNNSVYLSIPEFRPPVAQNASNTRSAPISRSPSSEPLMYKDNNGQVMFSLHPMCKYRWVDHGDGTIGISEIPEDGGEPANHEHRLVYSAWIERARQDGTSGCDDSRLAGAFLKALEK